MIEQLAAIVGDEHALAGTPRPYGSDATGDALGFEGRADAVVRPADAEQARRVVAWCYDHDLPIVPRGGGTGFSGGAVPIDGGVVLSLERLTTVRALDPELWRMHVDAGVTTATVARLARENGLLFPPNPGAAEQSQIGGNVATNAGGPRAFKYGVTGRWVTGLEAIVAPGEIVRLGGFARKDVAGYDLRSLLIGSEGTLGIVMSVWLTLLPAPEAVATVVAFYPDVAAGTRAIATVLAAGLRPAAIEFADAGVVAAVRGSFPEPLDGGAGFLVLLEIDGTASRRAAGVTPATATSTRHSSSVPATRPSDRPRRPPPSRSATSPSPSAAATPASTAPAGSSAAASSASWVRPLPRSTTPSSTPSIPRASSTPARSADAPRQRLAEICADM